VDLELLYTYVYTVPDVALPVKDGTIVGPAVMASVTVLDATVKLNICVSTGFGGNVIVAV